MGKELGGEKVTDKRVGPTPAGTIFEMTAEGVDNVEDKLESVKDLGGTPLASPDTIVGGAMFEFTVEGASQSDVDTALEGVKELGGEKVTDKPGMSPLVTQ